MNYTVYLGYYLVDANHFFKTNIVNVFTLGDQENVCLNLTLELDVRLRILDDQIQFLEDYKTILLYILHFKFLFDSTF